MHWFVRWITQYPHWAISTLGNIAVSIFIWMRGCRDRICITQAIVGVLSMYLVAVAYSPCSLEFYRWTNLSIDVLCSIMELAIFYMVLCRCADSRHMSYPQMAVLVSIFAHQYHKLFWHWSSELFHLPDSPAMETFRFASNLATIAAVAVLVYDETGTVPLRTIHEQEEVHR
jgi:hypothetical protein